MNWIDWILFVLIVFVPIVCTLGCVVMTIRFYNKTK